MNHICSFYEKKALIDGRLRHAAFALSVSSGDGPLDLIKRCYEMDCPCTLFLFFEDEGVCYHAILSLQSRPRWDHIKANDLIPVRPDVMRYLLQYTKDWSDGHKDACENTLLKTVYSLLLTVLVPYEQWDEPQYDKDGDWHYLCDWHEPTYVWDEETGEYDCTLCTDGSCLESAACCGAEL
jgi:hypothetical protein